MSQVQNNANKREEAPGRPSQVLNVVPIDWYAFRFTDSQSMVDVAWAAAFGKSAEDGEPHIAVVQPEALKQLLTVPHKHILLGLRARIKALRKVNPEIPDLPAEALNVGDVL